MLIVLIILTILCVVVSFIADYDHEIILGGSLAGAFFLGIASVLCLLIAFFYMIGGITAEPKIKMYQEENAKIEEDISVLVKEYMEFEKDTYKEFKTESVTTLVALFPELKSDELVNRQITVYIENNNKIKGLKEAKIDMAVGKWLLYFGG